MGIKASRRLGRLVWGLWLLLGPCALLVQAQSNAVVLLDSPPSGTQVQGDVDLVGTVRGPGLLRYELHYRATGSSQEFIYFDGDQIPIEAGVLGRWSTGSLSPGDYEIRLRAIFEADQVEQATITLVLVGPGTGEPTNEATEPAPDVTVPSLQTDTSLRQALDQLALRARPVALWAYWQRGMRWSGMITLLVLAYWGLKTLLIYLQSKR